MSTIQRLTPINLLEEKEKFFADMSYNPQFVYEDGLPTEELTKHGRPDSLYIELASAILEEAYRNRNEADLFMMEGKVLSQQDVTQRIETFLEMHKLQDRFKLIWSQSFVSRASITTDTLKLRLPAEFRKEGLIGMLYHEIGTHAIRRINYEKQPWYKRKKKYGFSNYLLTEEGLASIHSLIPHSFKLAYIPAIRYLAVEYAQEGSFVEVWQKLGKYVQDPERRWQIVFRQKRGLTDTSQPGGFTKDMVYFQGLVETWEWLRHNDFDPTDLYYGKLAAEDVATAKELNPNYEPFLPSFFSLDPDLYKTQLEAIGYANHLTQLD